MKRSESIKEIAGALLKFHAEVGKIVKDDTNPFYKSKYAALPAILDSIKEPLQTCGLVVSQHPDGENELTTLIIHAPSGEWIESTYKMVPVKNTPQEVGSSITYQRRYALGAALNLNIDEDDDGNKASGKVDTKTASTNKGASGKVVFMRDMCTNTFLGKLNTEDQNCRALEKIFDLKEFLERFYEISDEDIQFIQRQLNMLNEKE